MSENTEIIVDTAAALAAERKAKQSQAMKDYQARKKAEIEAGTWQSKTAGLGKDTLVIMDGERKGTYQLNPWLASLAVSDLAIPDDKKIEVSLSKDVLAALSSGSSGVYVASGGYLIKFKR